jgi:hypothetical protein
VYLTGTSGYVQSPAIPDLTPNLTVIASEGGPESDHAQGVAIDASGNVYVVGNFSGTVKTSGIWPLPPSLQQEILMYLLPNIAVQEICNGSNRQGERALTKAKVLL